MSKDQWINETLHKEKIQIEFLGNKRHHSHSNIGCPSNLTLKKFIEISLKDNVKSFFEYARLVVRT